MYIVLKEFAMDLLGHYAQHYIEHTTNKIRRSPT